MMLIFLLLALVASHQIDPTITQITTDNFEANIGAKLPWQSSTSPLAKQWFVMYYSPTCPHCQKAMPSWNQFAQATTNSSEMKWLGVGAVNCLKEMKLCDEMKVTSYPTFLYYTKDHKTMKFNGTRSKEGYDSFAHDTHQGKKPSEQKPKKQSPKVVAQPGYGQKLLKFWRQLKAFQILELIIIILLSIGLGYLICLQDEPEDFKNMGVGLQNQPQGTFGIAEENSV